MYDRPVLLLILVVAIVTGGMGESSYSCQCATLDPSPYQQQCCNATNFGKLVTITKDHKQSLIQCPSTLPAACPTSCKDVLRFLPDAASGYYNIYLADGSITSVYCNMEGCDGEGGWTRVAYLNMSDPSQQCPTDFQLYDVNGVRACGRQHSLIGTCHSVTYSTNGISYSEVCGRVIGYQVGSTDGVVPQELNPTIDSSYVEGVSITHRSPRQHIWTMMAGLREVGSSDTLGWECPCNIDITINVPSFIGDNYFCESGNPFSSINYDFLDDDPLWDGEGCGGNEGPCCNVPGIPWFFKVLNSSTTDDIELRVCGDQGSNQEDAPVSLYEIYVK